LDQHVLDTVDRTPGVAAAVPVVQAVTYGHTSPTSGRNIGVVALGVDCRIEAFVGSFGCDPQSLASPSDSTPPLVAPSLARRPGASLALGAFLPSFGMRSIFAIAIAAVLVYDTVTLSVEERRRDLAIVGALGGRSRTVVGGTMLESGLLGLAGGLLGGVGAILLAKPITASMSSFTTRFVGIPVTVQTTATPFVLG